MSFGDRDRAEAERRVHQACSLIASAYRLHDIEGAEMAATDVRDAVEAT